MTMSHSYPPDIRPFVQQAIKSGEYQSEEELVFAAVRVLRELKRRHSLLRRDVEQAITSMEQGKGTPLDMDEIKSELKRRLKVARANQ